MKAAPFSAVDNIGLMKLRRALFLAGRTVDVAAQKPRRQPILYR